MSFGKNISQWAKETREKTETITEAIFTEICTRIVERTPIGDKSIWGSIPSGRNVQNYKPNYRPGTLVNSWYAGIGEPPANLEPREYNVTGQASFQSIQNISKNAPGNVAYFVNPTPYANRAEHVGWVATTGRISQLPYKMVGLTVNEFKQIVNIVTNEYR